MALLLAGAPAAAKIMEGVVREAAALRERGIVPCLALLRLGERPDDLAYTRSIRKKAGAAGLELRELVLPGDAARMRLLETVGTLNGDPSVHGVLVFRPLPVPADDAAVSAALDPAKDPDGITPAAQAALYAGRLPEPDHAEPDHAGLWSTRTPSPLFAPCTAAALLALLDHYGAEIAGKRAVVVGRSTVAGRPLAMLLLRRDATVTLCHSRTEGLPALCREADIVVAALGKREFLGADCFRPGQWVLDAGIHVREDGSFCGDVHFAAVKPLVAAISPVPGGPGALTPVILAAHTVRAAAALAAGRGFA